MDTIKLLGDLLGNKQLSKGMGQQILKTILGGGGGGILGGAPQQQRAPQPSFPQQQQSFPQQGFPQQQAGRSPADIMRGGGGGGGAPGGNPLGGLLRQAVEQFMKKDQPRQQVQAPVQQQPRLDPGNCRTFPSDQQQANQQAQMLIRAMIMAAKSDGQVTEEEQQNIISRMGHLSQDEIDFLRHEFAQPINIQGFARTVPQGLEDEVYALSLTAIDLDTNKEARYLHELSHALGLSHQQCNQIHAQLGAPQLYA